MFRLFTRIKYYALIIFLSILTYLQPLFGQVKIMPLGDSITRGKAGSYDTSRDLSLIGYRFRLYNSLRMAGYSVNFVGNQSEGSDYLNQFNYTDGDHEGHGGWLAYDPNDASISLADHINSWLTALGSSNAPSVILLHAGTNDLDYSFSAAATVSHDSILMNNIYSYNSNMVVFLAKIINRGKQVYSTDPDSGSFTYISSKRSGTNSTNYSFNETAPPSQIYSVTNDFNKKLTPMAVKRILNGNRIIMVDMSNVITNTNEDTTAQSSFPHGDMWDSYHPNQNGYNKMADVWFKYLSGYLSDKPSLIYPLASTSYENIKDTLVWGITKNAVSYRLQLSRHANFDTLAYNVGDGSITSRFKILNNSDSQLNGGKGFLSSTTYYWRVESLNSGMANLGSYSDTLNFTTTPLYVNTTVFLQGPFATGTDSMYTILWQNGLIPTSQPYNRSPWNYSGTENVSKVPKGVVDWVIIELRSSTAGSTLVKQRAAFLKSNGKIVDLDGVSQVSFSGISFGNYYIVVRHRNHLAIMSSSAVSLASNTLTYDFTTSEGKAYTVGASPMDSLGVGRFGLFSGDANADGSPDAFDNNLYWNPSNGQPFDYFTSGRADYNLDGGIDAFDANLYWKPNNGKATQVPN